MSRPTLAKAISVSSDTIKNWEAGNTSPTALALAALHIGGGDPLYIVTGHRVPSNLVMEDVPPDRLTPAKRAAAQLTSLRLSDVDADLVITLAKRLTQPG